MASQFQIIQIATHFLSDLMNSAKKGKWCKISPFQIAATSFALLFAMHSVWHDRFFDAFHSKSIDLEPNPSWKQHSTHQTLKSRFRSIRMGFHSWKSFSINIRIPKWTSIPQREGRSLRQFRTFSPWLFRQMQHKEQHPMDLLPSKSTNESFSHSTGFENRRSHIIFRIEIHQLTTKFFSVFSFLQSHFIR